MEESQIIIQGQLFHRSRVLRIWKQFTYWLINETLLVSKTHDFKDISKQIQISHDTQIILKDRSKTPHFIIQNRQIGSYYLRSTNLPEILNWVFHLRSITCKNSRGIAYSLDQFRIIKVLGRGFYGKVQLVENLETCELFALKAIKKRMISQINQLDTVMRERNLLSGLPKHPFIINLRFTFQTATKFYFGLEYAGGGELLKHITQFDHFPISETRLYIAELVLALNHLHENGYIHRDVKPGNVLLDSSGHIKLTDFGLSQDIKNLTNTFCGTPEYMSYEMISRNGYSFETDWWSLGILIYEIFFQSTPFYDENENQIFDNILNKEPSFPKYGNKQAQELITILLRKDPKERAGFKEIKSHSFFSGLNWEKVYEKKILPESFEPEADPTNLGSKSFFDGSNDSSSVAPSREINVTGFTFGGSQTATQAMISSDH